LRKDIEEIQMLMGGDEDDEEGGPAPEKKGIL
jgi:hypothetical protein